jgi:hypothetical protein
MTYKLFIDDERNPVTDDWIVVRSSVAALDTINDLGIPIEIAFDHDLGGDDTSMKFIRGLEEILYYNRIKFPTNFSYSVHSQNPIGKANIIGLMNALLKEYT